jgi:SAM-dependent methyltransferase
MKKVDNDLEIILDAIDLFDKSKDQQGKALEENPLEGKVIVDVGCGGGDLVRKLAENGARVTGIDTPEMIQKSAETTKVANESFIAGKGEALPMESNIADMIIYMASFHHIPTENMTDALIDCKRVLKKNGLALFLEPVAQEGSYFELIRFIEDERDIQDNGYEAIKGADVLGLKHLKEELIYFERSFDDYIGLLDFFVDDENERDRIKDQALQTATRIVLESGSDLETYRFKSICRINIVIK